jgi:hypothetical protein
MKGFCDQFIANPILHPERYNEDAFIPAPRFVSLYGRRGNAIATHVKEHLKSHGIRNTLITARPSTVAEALANINDTLQKKTKHVLLVENAELLATADEFLTLKEDWQEYSVKCVIVFIFGVPPSELPYNIRLQYFGHSFYVPPPSLEERQCFFQIAFSAFAAHTSIPLSMTEDDYMFLAECSSNLTHAELQNWCYTQFQKIYNPTLATTTTVTLDFLKQNKCLYNVAGAMWQLLEYDGNSLETKFSMDSGNGPLAVRDLSYERAVAGQEEERQRAEKRARTIIDGDGVEKNESP